jgi:hypothetical protein
MQRWNAVQCCSLVGVGSVGKSNLLQHLANPLTQTHYLNASNAPYRPVIIDANMLISRPSAYTDDDAFRCWSGYELMMHRMFLNLYPFDSLPAEEAQRFYDLYQTVQDGRNPLFSSMALRYFELAIDLCSRHGIKFVFLLDEFEELLKQMPAKFFQTLRGIRDANKRGILYLTFSRAPLSVLIERAGIDALAIEPFTELFSDHTSYVGPYNETDARAMMSELVKRTQLDYPTALLEKLLWVTGGYAGLLRSGFSALNTMPTSLLQDINEEALNSALIARRSIQDELNVIWSSLTDPEHYVLKAVARLVPYQVNTDTELTVAMLVQKRLVRLDKTTQKLTIEPPLFRAYIAANRV